MIELSSAGSIGSVDVATVVSELFVSQVSANGFLDFCVNFSLFASEYHASKAAED